jgi:hypothetical protein
MSNRYTRWAITLGGYIAVWPCKTMLIYETRKKARMEKMKLVGGGKKYRIHKVFIEVDK